MREPGFALSGRGGLAREQLEAPGRGERADAAREDALRRGRPRLEDYAKATQRVWRAPGHASAIELPVIAPISRRSADVATRRGHVPAAEAVH
jgi:hypothetical protein